jgi:hypothetical protein
MDEGLREAHGFHPWAGRADSPARVQAFPWKPIGPETQE